MRFYKEIPEGRDAGGNAGKSAHMLLNLQVLRALAASSVVIAHALHETEILAAATGRAAVDGSAWNLGFGVDIFFVLSGFIMTHTAASEFGKSGAPLHFFLRRCARVVPLYWLLTSIMLLGALAAPSLLVVPVGSISHVLASYFFIPSGRGVGEIRPVLALGWTLNYEMLFYVFFALALLLPIRVGVIWLSVLMVGMALVGNLVDPSHVQIAFWTSPIILEFLFGVYVALIFRSGVRIGKGIAFGLVAIGLLGFVHVSTLWNDAALPQFLRSGLPAALFVLAAAIGPVLPHKRPVLWSVALGDASYSLYLAHPFILRPMRAIWAKVIGGALPLGLFAGFSTLAAALLALALFRGIEKPLTRRVQSVVLGSARRKRISAGALPAADTESA
ncbi:peptidoglycan/LPS O-acetylase OafA/YrhL [Rhizobium sp. ERR 922]|uniref:acyltransferase family protein n=2 Tax=Rhizobium TaxID=379 RepID=UPI00119AD0A7|nr:MULTISPECIES: acyltransferase [unclassified Rhizobium]TWB12567.1 peptidoglycan/LPS O-acetylase OafA/YrhL [Rhizobium sp. ERR1071]TWB58261.1 peptidoglycan/LPS O-acetylase OafA/YrhL [Rhizobium sp. ERR 922]TWB99956.1 peptidoglycan/LPS O-acetylase OafA/YrhL [Rhizobium sp. ERR 942]